MSLSVATSKLNGRSLVDCTPGYTSGRVLTNSQTDFWASFWFLLPVLAVFIVLTVIPLCQSIVYSFTDYNGYSTVMKFVGWDNYVTVFSDPSLLVGLGFTVIYALSVTTLITVLAIPLSITLNRKFFGRDFARALFFFLGVPAQAILGLVWKFLFSPLKTGAINQLLISLGFDSVPWLSVNGWARFCVIFVAVWAQVGWHATLYLAYLQAIPRDLYEQAFVDGANARQRFIHITLPQLIPAIVVSTFLLMSGSLKVYDLPFTLTGGGPGYATNTITQSIINRGIGQSDYGVGSALAILFMIATMIVVFTQMWLSNLISRRFQ